MPTRSADRRSLWEVVEESDGWTVWMNGRMERRVHEDQDSAMQHVRRSGGREITLMLLDGTIELIDADD